MAADIAALRRKAKGLLLSYHGRTAHLDCGHHMAQHIVAGARSDAKEFNAVMDELAALDPACPKTRLPVAT